MILRASHEDGLRPVDQGEERGLRSGDPLFDQHCAASPAESAAKHFGGGVTGLIGIVGDDNALAGGETVGLDDAGTARRADGRVGAIKVTADGETGLRDPMARADLACERLRPFKLRRRRCRPEGGVAGLRQPVDKPGDKWRFRSDDNKVRTNLVGKRKQPVNILGTNIDAAAKRCHRGASRGDDKFLGKRRAGYRPGQRVLAAAAADKENFHKMVLPSGAGRSGAGSCALPGAQYGIR